MTGIEAVVYATGAAAVVTTSKAISIPAASVTASAAVTNAYGLFIEDQTVVGSTLNYALDVNGLFRVSPTGSSVRSPAYITTTTTPAVANIGANSCGTDAATIAGTDNAWQITVGATAGTACRVTFDTTAPTSWFCAVGNSTTLTLNATPHMTASTATTADITATAFVAGDKLTGVCFAR